MQTAMVVPSLDPEPGYDRVAAKQALRRNARAARNAFVAGLTMQERASLEARLTEVLLPLLDGAKVVSGYAATGSEIDPTMILWHAGNRLVTTAFPAFASVTSPMLFRSGTCAEDCPVGGVQPPRHAAEVAPDLVLVPLLAVDRRGMRLGQGGGHFDRALPTLKERGARVIGIGWPMQMIAQDLPVDPWDMRLDAFASPDGLVEFT